MATTLVIAGHGKNANGSFDPGATGFITKGEHKYYVENFFPAVRKYLPAGHEVVLFSEYNVYDRSNLVALANKYGKDTRVIEMHYDATGSESANGGHVIVHSNYEPDQLDLKLRDVIKKHIGVRYNHKGHSGVSGRNELRNCNLAANGNVNYRLVELGFGTNRKDADIMLTTVDALAKDFVMAICGKVKTEPKPAPTTTGDYTVKKGDTLWDISVAYSTTVSEIKKLNKNLTDLIVPGQKITLPAPKTYTVKSGDTLSGIGAKLGIKWQTIASKNGLKSPYVIHPGQKLKY